MPKFGYLNIRQMDPRPGKKYATKYYQQSRAEAQRAKEHVDGIANSMSEMCMTNPEAMDVLSRGMPGFSRRESAGSYSALAVVNDLQGQLHAGKDIPEAMMRRWNRMFTDRPDLQIEMVLESELPSRSQFGQVFDHG